MQLTEDQKERFASMAPRGAPDACWPWRGPRNSKGYGQFRLTTVRPYKHITASRMAWALANGRDFPAGLLACHACDNPCCVNPAHIWPGTHRENVADMLAKRRAPRRGANLVSADQCRNGHARTADNTIIRNGRRCCLTCRKAEGQRRARAGYFINRRASLKAQATSA